MAKDTTTNIFCYGTLNIGEVQDALWGERKTGEVAELKDYQLRMYTNNIFFLRKKFGETVAGKVYSLTPEQLEATNKYEGRAYKLAYENIDGKLVGVYVYNNDNFVISEQD